MIPKTAELIRELSSTLEGDVLSDDYSLGIYSTDASIYQIRPLAIVHPKHRRDVLVALQCAARHKVSVLPRGGGTSLAGQTVGRSLIIDFSRYMNRILEIDPERRRVRVEPGIVLDELNRELESYGLHFAPDPATSSRANVGGMVGNNSSGTKSILYGKTVDHVLEAEVILADLTLLHLHELSDDEWTRKTRKIDREGEIYRGVDRLIREHEEEILARFPKVMRRVGGYNFDELVKGRSRNLAKLITGSEGTLATTVELTLNLEPLPKSRSVVVAHFAELNEAIRAVRPMLDFEPAAVEILDRTVLRMSRENLTTRRHCHFIEGDPAAILIVEFYGDSPDEVMERPQRMIQHLQEIGLGYAFPMFPEGSTYDDVWLTRKKGLGLMLGIQGERKPLPFIEDACVPVEDLPDYIDEVLAVCERHQTDVSMYAHASVGVIHVRPLLDLRRQEDIDRLVAIAGETFDLVLKYEGAWSGEHGDGLVRSSYNERFFGPHLYSAFRNLKLLFDPENRMNPGKIVDSPPMDRNLRYGTDYEDRPVETEFAYRDHDGFHASVHMCTGVGECRKMNGGTMCPSYRATRLEEHSTRGRANALRLAMSGQLDGGGLTGHRLNEVLDLCLSCKACKSECPSNVDMARLKSEVLQMHYDRHGAGIREMMVRDTARVASHLSGAPSGMINAIQRSRPFRYLLQAVAGIDRRRILPAYARLPLHRWFDESDGPPATTSRTVVLFADTFVNYHEPSIGRSAVRLLRECGFHVKLANAGCCQRPKISHGFLRDAKAGAESMLKALEPHLEADEPIVVCEPSCASSFVDDLPDLLPDHPIAGKLADRVHLLESFLAEEINRGRLSGEWSMEHDELLLHGHCHQKAIWGTEDLHTILDAAGVQWTEIDSGCCGMAGAFGYEADHYEISSKIGEQSLFPAVRSMPDTSQLIAGGFSCRHQISHFTEVEPKHWIEFLHYQE